MDLGIAKSEFSMELDISGYTVGSTFAFGVRKVIPEKDESFAHPPLIDSQESVFSFVDKTDSRPPATLLGNPNPPH
jgi:hypothetical protein